MGNQWARLLLRYFLICLLLFWGGLPGGHAQESPPIVSPDTLVSFSPKVTPLRSSPGQKVHLSIDVTIQSGWYIYTIHPSRKLFGRPTKITLEASPLEPLGPFRESVAHSKPSKLPGRLTIFHTEHAQFAQDFQVPETVSPETTIPVLGKITYQVCNSDTCYAPHTTPFETQLSIVSRSESQLNTSMTAAAKNGEEECERLEEAGEEDCEEDEESEDSLEVELGEFEIELDEFEMLMDGGFWQFIVLALVTGLFAVFTPCIFPMIPITVSFFTRKTKASRVQTIKLALIFSLGIVVTYTTTGVLMSVFVGATGALQLVTNPWMNLIFGLLLICFGFSLMGFFPLHIPGHLENFLDQKARQFGGMVGIILMGLAFTFTSLSCTVQFVGTLLIASAQGHWLWPILGMLAFSAALSSPFFLLALFPRWVRSFQSKAGVWMLQLKFVLGLVEIAAAVKFLSNADLVWQWGVMDRTLVLSIWMVISLTIALFLFGMVRIRHIQASDVGFGRFVAALLCLLLVLYLGRGWAGNSLDPWTESFLPPELSTPTEVDPLLDLGWFNDFEAAQQESMLTEKPLFIDFTGYTCVNCRWMEAMIFSDPRVLLEFQQHFVLAQLYTDGGKGHREHRQLLLKRFKTLALPTYAVVSADDQIVGQHSGIVSTPEAFLKFLRDARRKPYGK